jgi:hypothetical protein
MPYQVDGAVRHAMSGTELSRVRTELRLLLREHINQRLLASRTADIVTQSSSYLDPLYRLARSIKDNYATHKHLRSSSSLKNRVL